MWPLRARERFLRLDDARALWRNELELVGRGLLVHHRVREVEAVAIALRVDEHDAANLRRLRVDVEEQRLIRGGRLLRLSLQDPAAGEAEARSVEPLQAERLLHAAAAEQ